MSFAWAFIVVSIIVSVAWVWTSAIKANVGGEEQPDQIGFDVPEYEYEFEDDDEEDE